MNIDRNNYEMFFLLYVDNELSAAERNAVEKFVAENADLQTELELLMKTTLNPEEIGFAGKESLYKKELAADRLQEQILMHLDNELDPASVVSLSSEIAASANVKREWNILQQTKLDPSEKIVFEDKRLLYRHERDRVVPMYFWRAAAAVLIISLAIFIGVTKFSKTSKPNDVASENKNNTEQNPAVKQQSIAGNGNEQQKSVNQVPDEKNNSTGSVASINENNKENNNQGEGKIISTSSKENNKSTATNIINKAQQQNNTVVTDVNKKDDHLAQIQKPSNNLSKPDFENFNKDKSNNSPIASVQDNMKATQNDKVQEPAVDKVIAKTNDENKQKKDEDPATITMNNSYAKNASVDESKQEEGNNSILLINEDKVNRTKIGGLFRKVKRVLARNTNMKSGNGLKVAGFDIATR